MRYAIASVLLIMSLASSLRAAPGAEEDMTFQKNLDLLHVQMKLRVLSIMRDNDFFVPKSIVKRYLDEQDQLCLELGAASKAEIDATSDWAKEMDTAKKAEEETMEKVAEDWGRKFLGAATAGADNPDAKAGEKSALVAYREYQLGMAEFHKKEKKSALEVARFVENYALKIKDNANYNPIAYREWRRMANQTYRGAVKDTDNLVLSLKRIEQERMVYDGALKAMKHIAEAMKVIEFVRDDKSTVENLAEKTRDAVSEYLKGKYGDGWPDREENIKFAVDKVYAVGKRCVEAYKACGDLDKDPLLAENPTALGMCKRMAVFTALYDSVLEVAKDTFIFAPIMPLVSVLEYYGKSMGLVTPFARAMQKFCNQVAQGHKGFAQLSTWGGLMDKNLGPFWETSLTRHYGMQIATGHDKWEGEDLKFYMVVPKELMTHGYFVFNQEQYDRMAEAIAAERLINARGEASRGAMEWVTENMFEWRSASVLSPVESSVYIESLKKAALKSPWLEKGKQTDLQALANGLPVTLKDKEVSASSLLSRLDITLDLLATELTVRTALPKYTGADSLKAWEVFKTILKAEKVNLPPDQVIKLFTYYASSGEHAEHLQKFLRLIANQRKWRKLGIAKVGIPLVTQADNSRSVSPSSNAQLTALIIVTDLAPGREVEAEVKWQLPAWAGGERVKRTILKNGLTRVTIEVGIPKDVPRGAFDVRVTCRLPIGDGEEAASEGMFTAPAQLNRIEAIEGIKESVATGVSVPPSIPAMLLGLVQAPSAPIAPAQPKPENRFREFHGEGTFDVEVMSLRIATTRCGVAPAITGVDVTSDDLEHLNPAGPATAIKFTLYRALSAHGPFTTARAEMIMRADSKVITPVTETTFGRIDKNEVRIADMGPDVPDQPRKPFYYQVSQQAIDAAGKPVGKEVRSNVTAPSTTAVILLRSELPGADGKLKASSSPAPFFYGITVSLSLPDQAFDVDDALFTVTSGGWTGHFYSTPEHNNNSIAALRVPGRFQDYSISVSAAGDGLSAQASYTVAASPDMAADGKNTAQRIMDEGARRSKSQQSGLDHFHNRLKEIDDELARKGASMPKFLQINNRFERAKVELELSEHVELHLPRTMVNARAEAAKYSADYPAWTAALKEAEKFASKESEIRAKQIRTHINFEKQIAAAPDARDDLKRMYNAEYFERREKEAAEIEKKIEADLVHHQSDLAAAAVYAGDVGTVVSGRQMQFSYWVKMQMMNNPHLISLAYSHAHDVAMLTGSREGAASIWEWANQMRLNAAKPEERAQVEQSMRPQDAPRTWWPRNRKHGVPDGKLKAEDIQNLSEQLLRNNPTSRPVGPPA